jgi:hypothetical protein
VFGVLISYSGNPEDRFSQDFHRSSRFLQRISGIVSCLGHDRFLPNPFQLFIHQSFYCLKLYDFYAENVVKYTKKKALFIEGAGTKEQGIPQTGHTRIIIYFPAKNVDRSGICFIITWTHLFTSRGHFGHANCWPQCWTLTSLLYECDGNSCDVIHSKTEMVSKNPNVYTNSKNTHSHTQKRGAVKDAAKQREKKKHTWGGDKELFEVKPIA